MSQSRRMALLGSIFAAAFAGQALAADWGFNTANEDPKTKPGDDFFRYANGAWLDSHQIPADKPAVSRRLEMTDRTGLRAARNREPFLLQTYRRDMGGGRFAVMRDASAPIFVQGRHWGGFRIGYTV